MNELDRIMEMYTLQKAKNVEFLNLIENVRLCLNYQIICNDITK